VGKLKEMLKVSESDFLTQISMLVRSIEDEELITRKKQMEVVSK